ncbi:hypothetical protein J4404_01410, partial [Candidatus Woesearchaeota archaeon]|nr:hypothetical protein [Candidatus Woesearchaeota archaeon]
PREDNRKGLIYYSTALATVLNLLGIPKGNKSKILRVPKFIFFESKEVIGAFIGGLFNADGNAGKNGIHIHTSNKEFSKDLQWLLKRLGIISFISSRKQNRSIIRNKIVKRGWLYGIHISGRKDIEEFLMWCNPDKKKCHTLLQNLKKVRIPYTKSKDILPIEQGLKLAYKEYRKNGGISLKEVSNAYNQKTLSKHNLSLILPKLVSKSKIGKELIKLINLPIRWVRIKSIKNINKKTKVYDLTVDKYHNFITNQIISHNTIKQDIINQRISIEDVSLLCLDEAHRSRMKYASTFVTKFYNENGKNKRILALTASPGSTKEKIDEIRENLFLDRVEIRTETDSDVKPYVQEKEIEWVHVKLPEEFNRIKELIKQVKEEKIDELKRIIPNKRFFNKKELLGLQFSFRKSIMKGNKMAFWGVSLTAQLLKLSYALELIETQGINQLIQYWDKLEEDTSKAAKTIVNDSRIRQSMQLCLDFKENKHPKMHKLKEIILDELQKNNNSKIIVFANYRNTIDEIYNELKGYELVKPIIIIGQKEGLSQKEQIERIKSYEEGIYNVMIGTKIIEEGLDIKGGANLAVFYESVPSEIRLVQRRGRVGRLVKGKIVFLITQKTRDEAYYWASRSKERTMKRTLYDMKEEKNEQSKLREF